MADVGCKNREDWAFRGKTLKPKSARQLSD